MISHRLSYGSSAVCIPGIFENAKQWTGSPYLTLGIADYDHLLIAATGSQAAAEIQQTVLQHTEIATGSPLTPVCFDFRDGILNRIELSSQN